MNEGQIDMEIDIWGVIKLVLESKFLLLIIQAIVIENFLNLKTILKIIRGVYLEFNEISSD